jgi:predicted NACHT family NTPase
MATTTFEFCRNKGLDLSFYVASLIRRFEQRVVPGADYTLRDCFVSPIVRRVRSGKAALDSKEEPDDGPYDLLDYLQAWADRPGADHISIVGEFGQGKSTALLAYCCDWANRWKAGNRRARVPLLIELRGKSPRRQAPDRFLAEWGDGYGLRGGALLNLVQSGRATIIFEGFDEVQDAGLRYDRFEQFKALWGFSYPGTKIVFTGRPNFFLDTIERQTLLRDSQAARDAGLANSEIFAHSFLDKEGISKALSKYPTGTVREILAGC